MARRARNVSIHHDQPPLFCHSFVGEVRSARTNRYTNAPPHQYTPARYCAGFRKVKFPARHASRARARGIMANFSLSLPKCPTELRSREKGKGRTAKIVVSLTGERTQTFPLLPPPPPPSSLSAQSVIFGILFYVFLVDYAPIIRSRFVSA